MLVNEPLASPTCDDGGSSPTSACQIETSLSFKDDRYESAALQLAPKLALVRTSAVAKLMIHQMRSPRAELLYAIQPYVFSITTFFRECLDIYDRFAEK